MGLRLSDWESMEGWGRILNSLGNMMRVRGLRHRPKELALQVHEEEVLVHGIIKGSWEM